MEVIDKERKNALLSIYSGYEPQPEPQPEPLPEPQPQPPISNYEHPNTYSGSGSGSGSGSYLDRASLTKQFGDFQDYKKQYTVHFCLYVINHDCDAPFVQYILAKNGQSYEFPKKPFLCSNIQQDGEKTTQCLISFNNFCIESLVDILRVQEELTPYTMITEYDGFIDDGENNIYVFFNCSNFENIQPPKYSRWCLIDTILQNNIDLTPISSQTTEFFNENPELINIIDEHGNPAPLPTELILCIEKDGEYIPDPVVKPDKAIRLYSPPIKTELFGNVFIFSAPIKSSFFSMFETPVSVNRHAVFIDKIKYLTGDSVENVDKSVIQNILKSSETEKYSGVSFKYNNNTYYSLISAKKFTSIEYNG
jgi:hypothetical protein